jgi:hypothetical protein
MATTRQVQAIRNGGYLGDLSTRCPLLPDSEDGSKAQNSRTRPSPLMVNNGPNVAA